MADEGWAATTIDELGDGPGFRKIRSALGVEAFGVNALVFPPGFAAPYHFHERQDELYFVHQGTFTFDFGDGTQHVAGPGSLVHVEAATHRRLVNNGDEEAVVVVVGGQGGYVGRDGRTPE
jgi:uncharacterized cupin superfamily protein